MSYSELAEARGIDRPSVIRIARRHRWQKQKGNDGTMRVAVPNAFLEAKRRSPRDGPWGGPRDNERKVIGLEARVELLTHELEREQAAVRQLTEQAAELREQRAAATARAEASEARVRDLTAGLEAIRERLAELREERAAVIAKAEAAEMRVDDQSAEVRMLWEGRAAAQAKAELLQVELDRMGRVEGEEGQKTAVPSDGPRRRFWRLWSSRG
jgi:hypothetical protein